MDSQFLVRHAGAGASRRTLYRQGKRLLALHLIRLWTSPRDALEPAVRRFLRARSRNYLLRLVGDRAFVLATAVSMLSAAAARATRPVNLSDIAEGTGGFVINGIDSYDLSGHSVSGAGDVNGDGLTDVIVGAMWADPGGQLAAGESYVVFGKADGTAVDLAAVTAGAGGFVINGIDLGDFSGRSVSGAGDVNGDGLADVIVGAPNGDPGGNMSGGESYVVFGKTDGAAVNLSAVAAGIGGFVINGINVQDYSSSSASGVGDVNGDGLADVVIGAPYADPNGDKSGQSYVVFGKADGTAVDLSDVAVGSGGFVINGIAPYDRSGGSVSGAGDVNGDGLADVIVSHGSFLNILASDSYVVFGKADGAPVNLSDVAAGNGGFLIAGSPTDRSGYSVSSAGDVNGDGLADVVVSAPYADRPGYVNAGACYVVFGKADGAPVGLPHVGDGSGGFVINGIDPFDLLGTSVSGASDVNGDGLADVIVSTHLGDPGGETNAGESYVVFGKANGAPVELADVAAGIGGFIMNGIDSYDHSGVSVSGAGDVNGDGLADVIVGAEADPDGNKVAGESYVVFSPVVRGDLDDDGLVGLFDFALLLNAWGPCPATCPPYCPGDLDGDCAVGIVDFLTLLSNWS